MAYDRLALLNPNKEDIPKVFCFDDEVMGTNRTFIAITSKDGSSINITKSVNEPIGDYINQLRVLRNELNRFISYLEHDR